jgi:hypothetical protein
MCGGISPLLNTPSWRGAQLKHRDNFTLLYSIIEKAEECRYWKKVTSDFSVSFK